MKKIKDCMEELIAWLLIFGFVASLFAVIPALNGNRLALKILGISILCELPGIFFAMVGKEE